MSRSPGNQARGDLVEVRVSKKRKIETPNTKNTSPGILDPDFAASSAPGWVPPARITPEHDALRTLKRTWQNYAADLTATDVAPGQKAVLIADLHDFEIYRTPDPKPSERDFELMSLHHLDMPARGNQTIKLSMDGFLSIGTFQVYVQGLPIELCSVEGYGQREIPDTVAYLQSDLAGKDITYDVWYRVGQPSGRYKRFHDPFLCVAQLSKHVVDYMEDQPSCSVGLHNFRQDFYRWLSRCYQGNVSYEKWHEEFNSRTDFRVDIVAYRDFLYREAYNLSNSEALLAHPIWGQCMVGGLRAIGEQPIVATATITTPYVYENFRHMYFGSKLRAVPLAESVKKASRRRKLELGFPDDGPALPAQKPRCLPYGTSQVKIGDVIAFAPNEQDTKEWKNTDDDWLAYVQGTEFVQDQVQKLFVLYMYRPSDTHISTAKYCTETEIFLSDNCNCQAGTLLSTDIKGKYIVNWSPRTISPSKGYFARQTYLVDKSAFVTLRNEHKMCSCRAQSNSSSAAYKVGDTVYITETLNQRKILEPVVLHQINRDRQEITTRRLLRIGRDCSQLAIEAGREGRLAPNELVLTDDYVQLPLSCIERRCHIRYVPEVDVLQNKLPLGYDRGGAADLWFISMGLATVNRRPKLVPLSRLSKIFRDGVNLQSPPGGKKLTGLSLFGGGGNLDRGLEDGGAVDFQYVVELDGTAIHTQRANAKDPSKQHLYWGSVDDYMLLLFSGIEHELVAKIGDVHMISAGSPCPGFSMLQKNIFSDKSLKNASLITTLLAAVEVLRPQYAILENVVSMGHRRKGLEDQNVLSQLVACLVSMGYQVSQYIMDSWSYGSGQQRSRVFVTIAAPGLEPIKQPPHTHSLPLNNTASRSLGTLPNGQRFGQREWYTTPFQHVSAGAIIADLPNIGNANVQTCISHPDHRVSYPQRRSERALLACIPREPPGCGYKEALRFGVIPKDLLRPGKEHGQAYQRIAEAGLIPTICTTVSVRDSHNGACVHSTQDRPLTVLDARRAQGYLDKEPIIGNRAEQYKIAGNGVDRKCAFAEGVELREAVMTNTRKRLVAEAEQEMVMNIDYEDTDHFSDAASDASGIDVAIPKLDGGDGRPRMITGYSSRQKRRTKRPNDDRDTVVLSSCVPEAEISSKSGNDLMVLPSQTPKLETVRKCLKSVTIQSRRPSLSPANTPSSLKRSYDGDLEDQRPQ